MSVANLVTHGAAVVFWLLTAGYCVMASREFIVEQFLRPELFPPVAWFARYWPAVSLGAGVVWLAPRFTLLRRGDGGVIIAAVSWVAMTAAWPFAAPGTTGSFVAIAAAAAAIVMLPLLVLAEYVALPRTRDRFESRGGADFVTVLIAAAIVIATDVAIGAWRGTGDGALADAAAALRTQLLPAMAIFLAVTLARAIAEAGAEPMAAEARLSAAGVGLTLGWFLYSVALSSISITGMGAAVAAIAAGLAIAVAVLAHALITFAYRDDGVRSVMAGFAPRFTESWLGCVPWLVAIAFAGIGIDAATQQNDWNFVFARAGTLAVWLLALGAAFRVAQARLEGATVAYVGAAGLVLIAHVVLDRTGLSAASLSPRTPAARWADAILSPASGGPEELYALLPAHTNVPRSAGGAPVDVTFAPLSGGPSASRPHIVMFVIDSLRRDYLSPYNPAVSFTPAIDAFAKDSLVFDRAFTQYGATGLSVPSIWIGGQLLHRQYVTPFAPMNALAKLLTHEQYAQWISMDNILDVILPPTPALAPLDRGVPVKDFRFCRTAEEIGTRLRERTDAAPLFVYSLPQDIHISVITREGSRVLDGDADPYAGFFAPVASRLRRLDGCFGTLIESMKAAGVYDNSIIIVTADHGDSLGEDGRFGHAYTLYPEVVRVPLIVHVPPTLRAQYTWDVSRAAYTTDLTPTLYRLLGHEVTPAADFYGESLAIVTGAPAPRARDRMIAASYGSVYAGVLQGGAQMYVADAIEHREFAFEIGTGAVPGRPIAVDPPTREAGSQVIRTVVEAIARAYGARP